MIIYKGPGPYKFVELDGKYDVYNSNNVSLFTLRIYSPKNNKLILYNDGKLVFTTTENSIIITIPNKT